MSKRAYIRENMTSDFFTYQGQ